MAIGSNVNPNYPIPGLDQSSKGFRDNFATIKKEIESLQETSIQITGALVSNTYYIGASQSIAINTTLDITDISIPAPDNAIQFNKNSKLTGDLNLIFDSGNISVGIGTSLPNPSYGIDCTRSIRTVGEVVINQTTPAMGANLIISTANTTVMFSNYDDHVEIGTESNVALDIITNSESRIFIDYNGNVGLNTRDPSATLHVVSRQPQIAHFYTPVSNYHNIFRLTTGGTNSTASFGVENIFGNTLGGMRMHQNGTLSLHTNEQAGSYLSTNSVKLAITKTGLVGIGNFSPIYKLDVNGTFRSQGIFDVSTPLKTSVGISKSNPDYALDVNGDISTSNAFISSVDPLTVDNVWMTIDAMPTTTFRSARYTIQIFNNDLQEVNLIECLVTHIDGDPYLEIIQQYQFPPPGSSLGTLQVVRDVINQDYIELQYQGLNLGNRVRLTKFYILL